MSKITQIQTELQAVNPAKFQQLCDTYLHKKGYSNINPIGLVIGAEKVVKGTPDTLIKLPNGKYLFAEYTTQEENVAAKFKKDLVKCFDESKTGVPVTAIEEIVLCHNGVFSSEDEHDLTEFCRQHGCRLTTFGMGPISYDLYQLYPGLAKDFLGVEVDTHQIIVPEDFVAAYNQSSFATPLDTKFQFREEEVTEIVDALSHYDLVIITGRAGVGKSRLALECCSRFLSEHPEWQTWCIFNRGLHLYDDLQVYFCPDGHYLIFVDDANRINFDYVLQLLHSQNNNRMIKIITTVRDYALEKVRKVANNYNSKWEIEIQSLTDEHIANMVTTQFNIFNPLYLERITSIANGNPRLAMMAARIAVTENNLQSIRDVSHLYDEYFCSIRGDISNLNDKNIMRVASIIAFFRHVDRSNETMMQAIVEAFNISATEFWSAAMQLHELEIVDMYENEVVRTSDQVLSTYLFYLTFFQERLISFETLLNHFFPQFSSRIIDILNPVLNSFGADAISDVLRPQVARYEVKLRESKNDTDIFKFMHLFWYLDQTGNLRFIRDIIAALEPQVVEWSTELFRPDAQTQPAHIPRALSLLRYAQPQLALELLCDYAEKRWLELPVILHVLINNFGYTHRSYYSGYAVEREVITVLERRIETGIRHLYPYLFCAVAENFLRVHVHHNESKGHYAVQVFDFQLDSSLEVLSLRETIWKRLFALYEEPEYRLHVLSVIQSYINSNGEHDEADIVSYDAGHLVPFIEGNLDPQEYTHCLLVHDYCELLTRRNVAFDERFRQRFAHENMIVTELLFNDIDAMVEMGHEEYFKEKREHIIAYCVDFELDDYVRFIAQCEVVVSVEHHQRNTFALEQNIIHILLSLADRNLMLYGLVIDHILKRHNKLLLSPWPIVTRLVTGLGAEFAWNLLTKNDYQRKHWWLFHYYMALPEKEITPTHLIRLVLLYKEAEPEDIPSNLDFLTTFQFFDPSIHIRIVRIILERTEENKQYGRIFADFFETHNQFYKRIPQIFAGHLDLLKRAYFAAHLVARYPDHNGAVLNLILDIDQTFAREYLWWLMRNEEWRLHRHRHRDYSFLWMRDDYDLVMTEIVEAADNLDEAHHFFIRGPIQGYFIMREGRDNADVLARQNTFLRSLIVHHSYNIGLMRLVFDVIANFGTERRNQFVAEFISHNRKFEDFTNLPLEPRSWGWTGSQVPQLEGRVAFYQSLLPLFATIELLDHRQHIEKCIQYLREDIEHEKKRDFMND